MLKKFLPQTVKARLIGLVGFAFLVLIAGIVTSTALERKNTFLQAEELKLLAKYDGTQKAFKDQAHLATSLALVIGAMPDVQKAFATRDRKRLSELTLPFFESEKERLALAQFQFHTPPATSFLRLHKPKKFGDDLSSIRQTVIEVNRNKTSVSGIEKGRAGLGIRGVVPMYMDGKHTGSVEFGIKLNDNLLKSLKDVMHVDISVVVPDGQGFKYLAKTHSLSIPEKSFPWLKKIMKEGEIRYKQVNKNKKDLMTVFGPLKDYQGKTIGVLAIPNDITSTMNTIRSNTYKMAGIGLVVLLITLVVFYVLMNILINQPLKEVREKFNQAGQGDLTVTIETENRPDDEFSALGKTFNSFIADFQQVILTIQGNVKEMSTSSTQLSTLASGMKSGAESTSERTNTVAAAAEEMSVNMNSVAAASEEASTNVNMVAVATEEMTTTIAEISTNTEQASSITASAVEQAKSATTKVNVLGKAANEVSKVTEVISEISEQTNLLALNATIEAARAGEAGKGFAVVANEIKELARQTSDATQQIKQQIEGIQTSTNETVTEIQEITEVINQVNEIVATITTAIEEQAATTGEIGTNVSQAALGIEEVNENVAQASAVAGEIAADINQVSSVTEDITKSSQEVNSSSDDLSNIAGKIQDLMSKFKV